MSFAKLYAAALAAGFTGGVVGIFASEAISAVSRQGWMGWLVPALLGFILLESCAMSLAVHFANHGRGNLPLTFLSTVGLGVPIPLLLPGFITVLALPLFLFQAWVCVKVQLASGRRRRVRRRG